MERQQRRYQKIIASFICFCCLLPAALAHEGGDLGAAMMGLIVKTILILILTIVGLTILSHLLARLLNKWFGGKENEETDLGAKN